MSESAAEFTRTVPVGQIGPQEQEHRIEASEAERRSLARRFGLVELRFLAARVTLRRPTQGGLIRLEADFDAAVVQSCVVTLEPVESRISDRIVLFFGREAAAAKADPGEIEVSIEADDPPEPIVNGEIDMGEAVAQGLALAIDPYPRKPGAAIGAEAGAAPPAATPPGPFAVLARLRKRE
jgi:hypothetical protein